MGTCLALTVGLLLPLAQVEGPEIVNVRPTFGYLGATRPPTGVFPGDVAHFYFDIKGMKLDAKGIASYSLTMEVINDKGETTFKEGPRKSVVQNFLGGDLLPCTAQLDVPLDSKPGIYSLRVTIEDLNAKKKAVFEGKGKVLDPNFGIVRVGTFADATGTTSTAPVGVPGDLIHLNFSLVHFQRDEKTKQPNIELSLKILDDKGMPTLAQPIAGGVNSGIPEDAKFIPLSFGVALNRVGNFQLELAATDKLSGKTTNLKLPLKVTTPN